MKSSSSFSLSDILPSRPAIVFTLAVFLRLPAQALESLSSKSGSGTCLRPAASATCFLLSSFWSPHSWILTCFPSPATTVISFGFWGSAARIAFILASLCLARVCLTYNTTTSTSPLNNTSTNLLLGLGLESLHLLVLFELLLTHTHSGHLHLCFHLL